MPRVFYFDFLNIFACISVISLHCNGYTHSYSHNAAWYQALVIETLFYSAVPIFFMLSGATLFNFRSRYSLKEFYKKRFSKTLIPYLFFGFTFYVLNFIKEMRSSNQASFDFHNLFNSLLTGQIPFANYWFFIPLFILYLFIPYLEKIVNHSSRQELKSLLLLLFTFQSIIPIANFWWHLNISQSTSIYGFCLYAILGFYLSKSELEKNNKFIFVFFILSVIMWIIRYIGLSSLVEHSSFWFNYYGLFALIPATTCFLLAKRLNPWLGSHPLLTKNLQLLSSLSFGIYLIHGAFLYILPFPHSSAYYRILGIPITYIGCCIIVFMLKKIPLIKRIVP